MNILDISITCLAISLFVVADISLKVRFLSLIRSLTLRVLV